MIRRPRRSVPAAVVAALLLALCVLVVVAVAQSLLGGTPFLSLDQLLSVTAAQQWDSAATVAVAVVLAVLGLVLLVAALLPGDPTVLPLGRREAPDGRPGADAGVRRRTYDKDLTAAVSGVPGVVRAEVSAGRAAITARVRVAATDPSVVPDRVRECLDARVLAIGPAVRPRVRVRARPAEKT